MMLLFRALLPLIALGLLSGCDSSAHSGSVPSPLPKGKTLRIMTLGDSITRGSGSGYGNYRRPLQRLLTQAGYAYKFVGGSTEQSFNYHGDDPEQTFSPYQPNHEGYGGFRIDQIAADGPDKDDGGVAYPGLARTLDAGKPDVILLMLGTNDINRAYDPGGPGYAGGTGLAADAAHRLDALVDRLCRDCPGLILVVATITPLTDPAKDAQVRAYNAYVPQIVAAHRKHGRNVLFGDMYAAVQKADLSPDGVHPGTRGYDKMARVWYRALTGRSAPPPAQTPRETGRLSERNLFNPEDRVTVSTSFASRAFSGAGLVDGTAKAFVFGNAGSERVAISGVHGPIGRLRFFDTPSYTGRTPGRVTVYYSASEQSSLKPGDYTKLGTFSLPVVGDAYEHPTQPPSHPDTADPASRPSAVIGFCDLDGLKIPVDARSVLLDFSKSAGDGDGLTEIQAFAPA